MVEKFSNKKGYMNIIESVMAILLIIALTVIITQDNGVDKEEPFEKIRLEEISLLREIQINETLRAEALSSFTPSYSDNLSFPPLIKSTLTKNIPDYLICKAKICKANTDCNIEEEILKNIYVQTAFISANATTYSPKEIKLFCWEK
jgi:hypothetical protein